MKFGIREVANMEFTKLSGIGPQKFEIDSAKTSTLEGASTTVYAQGGQGNARLMAWEGEKTLTFTVEDALITMESFQALSGAEATNTDEGIMFTVKSTSFAGYYSITAKTLFRDENGVDHSAEIRIPRAKLQSTLNIAMAPSGDPSTFTFVFDALPGVDRENKDVLFTLEIKDEGDAIVPMPGADVYVQIEGINELIPAKDTESTLIVTKTLKTGSTTEYEAVIKLDGKTIDNVPWGENTILTNMDTYVAYNEVIGTEFTSEEFELASGVNKFYIIED